MEKKILEEIVRMKEIMGIRVISEASNPIKPIVDDIIQKFAKKATTGDSDLKSRFKNFFDDIATSKSVYVNNEGILADLANGVKKVSVDDFFDGNETKLFGFIDDLLEDSTNGAIWKKTFNEALAGSSDDVFKNISKDLEDADDFIKQADNFKNTDPQFHDDMVDSLMRSRQAIEASDMDDELKKIILGRYGFDDIPEKVNVVAPVVDNVKDLTKKELLAKNWDDIVPLSDEEIANLRRANPLWDKVVNEWGKSLSDMLTGEVAFIDELQSSIKSLRDMLKSPDTSTENVGALTQRIGDLILKLRNKQFENFTSIDAWIKKNVPDSGIIAKIQDTDGYRMAKHLGTKEFLKDWEAKYLTKVEGERNLVIQLNSIFNPLSWLRINNMKKWGGDNWLEMVGNKWLKIISGPEFKKFRNKLLFGWDKPPRAYYQYAKGFGWYKTLGKMSWEYIQSRMVLLAYVALLDVITDAIGAGLYKWFPNWEWAKKQADSWSLSMGFETEKQKKEAEQSGATSSEGVKKLLQQFKYYFSNNISEKSLATPMLIDDLVLVYDAITNPSTEEDVKKAQEMRRRVGEAVEDGVSQADSVVTTHGIPVPDADGVIEAVTSDSSATEETPPTPTPPTPPTSTETTTPVVPGTASEQDKKSLKQQMNDDNYFDTEIISVDSIGGGRIKVTYKSKNPSGTNKYNELEKNSEGNWIYTYGKLKGQVY